MLIIWNFSFLYHKTQFCSYAIHIMTHLHLANDSWNLNILKLYFQISQFLNYECYSNVDGRLLPFQFFSYQNLSIRRIFILVLYKFDFGVLKIKNPLLKRKFNLLN
jgi:hypothetical protein